MNDEYLWQKTGEAPEIEKLEQQLAAFRYREVPLRIPSVEPAVERATVPRWRLSLAFAFAASVMAALLIVAVFVGISVDKDADTVFVASPEFEIQEPPAATTDEKKATPAPAGKIVPQFARNKRNTIIRTEPVIERKRKTKDPKPTSVASLTDEEKYAYRQLMLALSISSSKLKIVQDTINGNENTERTNSNNQR